VDFKNVDSVELKVAPADALILAQTTFRTPGSADAIGMKDAAVTITARALRDGLPVATQTLEIQTTGVAPKVSFPEGASAALGAAVTVVVEGPVGEDYQLVIAPAGGAAVKVRPIVLQSPFGRLSEAGGANGPLKLDAATFAAGSYDVSIKTLGGKESPKASLEVTAPPEPAAAGAGQNAAQA
ncbi:MAG TPA: hypothetical protein VHF22_10265, partial [Planctomycetota bacterium]|nr:hypothetical protein [Planctomycetota bacterium]